MLYCCKLEATKGRETVGKRNRAYGQDSLLSPFFPDETAQELAEVRFAKNEGISRRDLYRHWVERLDCGFLLPSKPKPNCSGILGHPKEQRL
jgi:hypothetical protein